MNSCKALNLKILDENDILGLIALSASVGWDYDEHEIRTVLSTGKIVGHKNETGDIVSSAAVIQYGTKLASIGMVIVNRNYRGLGLGKEATLACVNLVSEKTALMLIATPDGKPLYEGLGFKVVSSVHKFICKDLKHANQILSGDYRAVKLNGHDIEGIICVDREAFGDTRRSFLRARIKQCQTALVLKDSQGHIQGYGLSILGPENLILGPVVAPDISTAAYLINELARNHEGKLRIDVPDGKDELMDFLSDLGFEKVSNPPVMIRNVDEMLKRNNQLFAIAAQIFG
jgi:predicted GNAT family N-acyltransferase